MPRKTDETDTSQAYTATQLEVAAVVSLNIIDDTAWFAEQVPELQDPELQRFLPRILLRVFVAYRAGELLTKIDLSRRVGADHTKTVSKYLAVAKELGLVRLVDSARDARKTLIVPTDKLIDAAIKQLAIIADNLRYAGHALLTNHLPDTGAPILETETRPNTENNPFTRLLAETRTRAGPLVTARPGWSEERRAGEMLAMADEAIACTPQNARAHMNRGYALNTLGRYEEAIGALNKAVELDPLMFIAYIERGLANMRLHRYDDAAAEFTQALAVGPGPTPESIYFDRGRAQYFGKRPKEAAADFKKAVAVRPDYQERIDAFKAASQDPENTEAKERLRRLAHVDFDQERPDQAASQEGNPAAVGAAGKSRRTASGSGRREKEDPSTT